MPGFPGSAKDTQAHRSLFRTIFSKNGKGHVFQMGLWAILFLVLMGNLPAHGAQAEPFSESLRKAIAAEKASLEKWLRSREETERVQHTMNRELGILELQTSSIRNLLSLSSTSLQDLEKAKVHLEQITDAVASRLKELNDRKKEAHDELKNAVEQRSLIERQIHDLKTSARPDIPPAASHQLNVLGDILARKIETLQGITTGLEELDRKWQKIRTELLSLQKILTNRIEKAKKEQLFQRNLNPLAAFSLRSLERDGHRMVSVFQKATEVRFWLDQLRSLWKSGGMLMITSFLAFGMAELFLILTKRKYQKRLSTLPAAESRWRSIAAALLVRSLPLLGATLFVSALCLVRDYYDTLWQLRPAFHILLLWLFTSWGIHFLHLWSSTNPSHPATVFRKPLQWGLRIGRWPLMIYLISMEILGHDSILLLLYRSLLEFLFLGWAMTLGHKVKTAVSSAPPREAVQTRRRIRLLVGWIYFVATAGIFLELTGYGLLATMWYAGWGRGSAVFMWLYVCFMALREWEGTFDEPKATAETSEEETRRSLQWFFVRLLWMFWLLAGVLALLLAWGAKHAVITAFFRILHTPVNIGALSFRITGLFYAALLLAFTQVGSKWFRHLLRNRIFRHSGLERGLQESITTISSYVVWLLGILAALNALGFSGTSLTVVFGALGVGLGFGLQNIFNNFISGLILLFERPIQVGDAIEIDGTWGEVKKINVRSTVIQTRDNASLIIPNSEFINGRVTNWSFKDLRLRRNIDVGVAYGSDVECVRETLLEIARNHPGVHKYPKPDVLFLDFGDSALLFRLRVWTNVRGCVRLETDLRFAIEKSFRERGIEIPFPQTDIHIRSINPSNSLGGDGSSEPPHAEVVKDTKSS